MPSPLLAASKVMYNQRSGGCVLSVVNGPSSRTFGPWPHVPPHVWADVQEEFPVDKEGDDGELCGLC